MNCIHIMALRHSAFYTPLLMTMAGGYLREQGLDYTYTPATVGNTVPDNIRRGTCHVAQSAVATSFADLENGQRPEIVHFAQINSRDGFFIAGREADPHFNWDKLRGRRVLVDHFFQPLAMLRYALKQQGVLYEELQVIDVGGVAEIDQAFRDGRADFVHLQGPAPQQLEADGKGYVLASVGEAIGPVAFSSLCASRDWLATDMAKDFAQAYRAALQAVLVMPLEDIADSLFAEGFFPDIERTVLIETIGAYRTLGCWQGDPQISEAAYETLLDVFLFSGLITQRHAYDLAISPYPL